MDLITIKDLEVAYRVGVPDQERAQPQRLLLSLELTHDLAPAASSDDLGDTIDYYDLTQRLLRFGEGREWKLLERLAEELAGMVLTRYRPRGVTVEVKKFVIPTAQYVSVKVRRERLD